jgi:hypothetical protein
VRIAGTSRKTPSSTRMSPKTITMSSVGQGGMASTYQPLFPPSAASNLACSDAG